MPIATACAWRAGWASALRHDGLDGHHAGRHCRADLDRVPHRNVFHWFQGACTVNSAAVDMQDFSSKSNHNLSATPALTPSPSAASASLKRLRRAL